jgi:hypothetical protein
MNDAPQGKKAHLGSAARLLGAIRDGWLILGITMLMFLMLDLVWRKVRPAAPAGDAAEAKVMAKAVSLHPYRDSAWFAAIRLPDPTRLGHFDPYRTWWPTSFTAPGVHVDSSGIRRTQQANTRPVARRVFVFGGSAVWGFRIRDEHTIPSNLARGLATRGFDDVEVVNFGQLAYVNTQEVITLLLQLRQDSVPAVAVFLSGHNDVSTTLPGAGAGHVWSEDEARARFDRRDTPSTRQLLVALLNRSMIVQDVMRAGAVTPPIDSSAPPIDCRPVASYYGNLYRIARGIGREFNFDVLYAWQPTLAATHKPLTPYEAALPLDAWRRRHQQSLVACGEAAQSVMATIGGANFTSFASLFDADSGDVFLDNFGHLTERAAGVVGDTLAGLVAARLRAQRPATAQR